MANKDRMHRFQMILEINGQDFFVMREAIMENLEKEEKMVDMEGLAVKEVIVVY